VLLTLDSTQARSQANCRKGRMSTSSTREVFRYLKLHSVENAGSTWHAWYFYRRASIVRILERQSIGILLQTRENRSYGVLQERLKMTLLGVPRSTGYRAQDHISEGGSVCRDGVGVVVLSLAVIRQTTSTLALLSQPQPPAPAVSYPPVITM